MMKHQKEASYRLLLDGGKLEEKVQQAYNLMKNCQLCPHLCKIDRHEKKGVCRAGTTALVSSYGAHFGEEAPLVGTNGSGTIFFAFCNMKCIFCQNYEISWGGEGQAVSPQKLAEIMLYLQRRGCHNVNLVTPTHFVPQILEAVLIAAKMGLNVPLVYNCGGYERIETLKVLDGVIDIYMPDAKYNNSEIAKMLSGAPNYPQVIKLALKEMYRQVGDLQVDHRGIAIRGLIVRHLVLPMTLAGTKDIMKFIANEISPKTFVNIMNQYRPEYKASQHKDINRPITTKEYIEALEFAKAAGLIPYE